MSFLLRKIIVCNIQNLFDDILAKCINIEVNINCLVALQLVISKLKAREIMFCFKVKIYLLHSFMKNIAI